MNLEIDFLKWRIWILLDNSINSGCHIKIFWNKSWPQEQYIGRTSGSPMLGHGLHSCGSQKSTQANAEAYFWGNLLRLEDSIDTHNHSWVYLTVCPLKFSWEFFEEMFSVVWGCFVFQVFTYGDSNCSYGLTLAAKAQVTEWRSSKNFIELKKVGFNRAAIQLFPSQAVWLAVISPRWGSLYPYLFSAILAIPMQCCVSIPASVPPPCVPQFLGITFI